MVDISAGGVCLVAQEESEVQDDDYVRLSGNVEILPIDVNGMIGQITGTETPKEDDGLMLHVRFLSYEHDLRRQIISLVYEKQKPSKPSRKKGEPSRADRKDGSLRPRYKRPATQMIYPKNSPERRRKYLTTTRSKRARHRNSSALPNENSPSR